jgi:hypothetical protein
MLQIINEKNCNIGSMAEFQWLHEEKTEEYSEGKYLRHK